MKLSQVQEMSSMYTVVALPPNASDSDIQESDIKDILAENMEEIYEPAGELEIEEDLESDDEAEMPFPTSTKRRQLELPKWKKVSSLKELLKVLKELRKNLISQTFCQIRREIRLIKFGKTCFSRTY